MNWRGRRGRSSERDTYIQTTDYDVQTRASNASWLSIAFHCLFALRFTPCLLVSLHSGFQTISFNGWHRQKIRRQESSEKWIISTPHCISYWVSSSECFLSIVSAPAKLPGIHWETLSWLYIHNGYNLSTLETLPLLVVPPARRLGAICCCS